MVITICNFAALPDRDVERVCAAINRQIAEHFAAHWRFESRIQLQLLGANPDPASGDAVIYLWDTIADVPRALADEDPNDQGLPFGFVILEISEQLEEPWSVTLSREALALIGDTQSAGPHPADPSRIVFHWYEMCDAVEAETYEIDSVVSNFLLPSSFAIDAEEVRKDFLHRRHPGGALRSFGVNPGGSCGIVDPESRAHHIYSRPGDEIAAARLEIRHRVWHLPRLSRARRSTVYRSLATRAPTRTDGADS